MTHVYNWFRPLLTLFALLLCAPAPLVAQDMIFEDDFEGGPTPLSNWTFTAGADGGVAEITSMIQGITTNPGSGEFFAAVLGRSSDGGAVTNTMDLAVDLSGRSQVELTFDLQNRADDTQEVDGETLDGIFFSDNGGSEFVQVLPFRPSPWGNDFYGQLPPLDVDALAADFGLSLTDQFVIRFQQHDDSDFIRARFNDGDGFIIDNVRVYAPDQEFAPLPFADDFENDDFRPAWRRGFPQPFIGEEQWLIGGIVDIREVIQGFQTACSGDAAVVLGRLNDGNLNTNALDLRLNLSGETNVDLTFQIANRAEETQNPDGLLFSDDGGNTFRPVFSFTAAGWSNDTCGKLPPIDVDRLAAEVGLALTDQFVIRFQQHDDADFISARFNDGDGLFIDDVQVYVPDEIFAAPPFVDGFESGLLGSSWSVADAFDISKSDPDPISQVGAGPRPGGVREVLESAPRSGSKALALGRRIDGPLTTNAVDLRLDLSGQAEAALQFWLSDRNDDTEPLFDRVMISDNAGDSFESILEIDPGSLPNDQYNRFSIDLASSAAATGLSLTDQFIVRFQQQGDSDRIASRFNDADGFLIDDVRVVNRLAEATVSAGDIVDEFASLGISAEIQSLSEDATLYLSQTDIALEDGDRLNLPSDGNGIAQLLGIGKVWHADFDPIPTSVELDLCFDLAPYRTVFGLSADVLNVVTRPETASDWSFVSATELRDASGAVVSDEADATQLCAAGLTETSEFAVIGPANVLPVELSAFTAALEGDEAVLVWTTTSEENNAGFDVERSLDGGAFERLGFVEGAGTTETARQYRFTDRALPFDADVAAYRLRQIDTDGTVAVSDEVRVRRSAPDALIFHSPFPNPARDGATVRYEMPNAGPVRLALYNVLGQQVWGVSDEETRAGRIEHRIPTTNLASGLYFLRLETAQGTQTQRLSVVR